MNINILTKYVLNLALILVFTISTQGQNLIPKIDSLLKVPSYVKMTPSDHQGSNEKHQQLDESVLSTVNNLLVDIAFVKNDGLFLQRFDGSNSFLLFRRSSRYRSFRRPVWSNDSRKIALIAEVNNQRSEILIIDLDLGSVRTVFASDVNGTQFYSAEVTQISWSSNDRYLSVSSISLEATNSVAATTIVDVQKIEAVRFLPYYTHAQFDPTQGSLKLAFTNIHPTTVRSGIGVNDLAKTTAEVIWAYATDFSTLILQVAWFDNNNLYAVVNNNRIIKFTKIGTNVSNTGVLSSNNGTVSICSFDRFNSGIYFSNTNNSGFALFYSKLDRNGAATNFVNRGPGLEPSWASKAYFITTSTTNPIQSFQYKLFPNPANTWVHLELEAVPQKNYQLSVYNILGKVIFSKELRKNDARQLNIDVSQWSKGMYLVSLTDGEHTFTKQLTISN